VEDFSGGVIIRLVGSLEGLLVDTVSYRGFRFPPEIISHCVWLYHRFSLSLRDVEEMMLERGIEVSYERCCQVE
jgi:transposase-like protein